MAAVHGGSLSRYLSRSSPRSVFLDARIAFPAIMDDRGAVAFDLDAAVAAAAAALERVPATRGCPAAALKRSLADDRALSKAVVLTPPSELCRVCGTDSADTKSVFEPFGSGAKSLFEPFGSGAKSLFEPYGSGAKSLFEPYGGADAKSLLFEPYGGADAKPLFEPFGGADVKPLFGPFGAADAGSVFEPFGAEIRSVFEAFKPGKWFPPPVEDVNELYAIHIEIDDICVKICKDCSDEVYKFHTLRYEAEKCQLVIDFLTKMILKTTKENKDSNKILASNLSSEKKCVTVNNTKTLVEPNNHKYLAQTATEHSPEKICFLCSSNSKVKQQISPDACYLCPKHRLTSFTCLIPKCNLVFSSKNLFIKHYRKHLNLSRHTYLCNICYDVLGKKKGAKHQHRTELPLCCSEQFLTMSKLVLHKIEKHDATVEHFKTISPVLIPIDESKSQPTSINKQSKVNNLHRKLFTCIVPDCNKIYDTKKNNCDHYRVHAQISIGLSTCSNCLMNHLIVNGIRKRCDHKNSRIQCTRCVMKFDGLHELSHHKISVHHAVVFCGDKNIPGCPICLTVFSPECDVTNHYKKCFTDPKRNNPPIVPKVDVSKVILKEKKPDPNLSGVLKCQSCRVCAATLNEYIEHAKKEHNVIYGPKDSSIQLCPLCDLNFLNDDFVEHIGKCTDSMRVGDKSQNCFGCIYCGTVLKKLTGRQFRSHFVYCKSFKTCTHPGGNRSNIMSCKNCVFLSDNLETGLQHASQTCLFVQLKRRLALCSSEKKSVLERMQSHILYSMNSSTEINTSKNICDPFRRKRLEGYEYFCSNCEGRFFNVLIFNEHLKLDGSKCRKGNLWYCENCVMDFTFHDDYITHLENNSRLSQVPTAIPIPTTLIKYEQSESSQDVKPETVYQEGLTDYKPYVFVDGEKNSNYENVSIPISNVLRKELDDEVDPSIVFDEDYKPEVEELD